MIAPHPTPTDGELALLRVLWSRGAPMTVREVHDVLQRDKDTAYTTVLKMLTIMFDKGLVLRDESERSHRFVASFAEPVVESSLVDDFMQRTLGGSVSPLLLYLSESQGLDEADVQHLARIVDQLEGKEGKDE